MGTIWTMGELLVEVMRPQVDLPLTERGPFLGPFPSGAPGIFIDTVARLGHQAGIVSGVADDAFGRCILERLRHDGVNTDHVLVVPDKATAVAFVSYAGDGSRTFIFHWDGTPAVMPDAPPADSLPTADFFHVMGCSLMANARFRQAVLTTVERFADQGTKISFDPNIRFELLAGRSVESILGPILRHCSVLLPGERELQLLSGVTDLAAAARAVFRNYPLEVIALKRGSRGSTIYTRDGSWDVPAFSITEVDPTGAGDCFDAGFLCGMLEARSLADAARLAAAAGALNAQAFGPMEGDISPRSVAAILAQESA